MSETRQRWRLVFARDEEARYLSHLDAVTLWERALRRGGIPVATTEGFNPRPRIVFAEPLQLGMLAEHELADLYLSERMTAPALRSGLAAGMPAGYRLLDLYDVWTGATALAPQLAAADYRLTLLGVDEPRLTSAAAALLSAGSLQRVLRRENKSRAYDLRPLVLDVRATVADPHAAALLLELEASGNGSDRPDRAALAGDVGCEVAGLWMRLRHSQDRGSGRPDQVVSALADWLGLAGPTASEEEDREDGGGTESATTRVAPDGEPDPARAVRAPKEGGTVEMVLPVRERLWLADEALWSVRP